MQTFKERHHKFLTVLLLLGTLLIIGSFSSEAPKPAIAASTPGQQSVTRSSPTIVTGSRTEGFYRAFSVLATGETRKSASLTQVDTVLNTGDQITFNIIENAAYNYLGGWWDTPPAPWINAKPANADIIPYCEDPQHVFDFSEVVGEEESVCGIVVAQASPPSLSLNGLSCNPFNLQNIAYGIRQYSTICTVTGNGPQATLQADLQSVTYHFSAGRQICRKSQCGGFVNRFEIPPPPVGYSWGWASSNLTYYNKYTGEGFMLGDLPPATLSWTFDVASVPPPPPPTLTFWADSTNITQGDSTNLNWTVANADSCTATGGWLGSKDPATGTHSQSVTPPATTTYNLQCSGPGGSSGQKQVTITTNVASPNSPPFVDAGPNQNVPFPSTVNLNGLITDDGLPNPPGTVTALWSKVNGPGTVTFGNSTNAVTTASFSLTGTYVLRLTGSDSVLSNSDNVTIMAISGSPMTVSCSANLMTAFLGQTITWTANVSGGTQPFTYSWAGTNIPTIPAPSINPYSIIYSTTGQKTANVIVTDSSSPTPKQASCSVPIPIVRINFDPTLEEF